MIPDLAAALRAAFGTHGCATLHQELVDTRDLAAAPEVWQALTDAVHDAAFQPGPYRDGLDAAADRARRAAADVFPSLTSRTDWDELRGTTRRNWRHIAAAVTNTNPQETP